MVISEYSAEVAGGLIIGVTYTVMGIYEHVTRRRLFNRVAEILAKP